MRHAIARECEAPVAWAEAMAGAVVAAAGRVARRCDECDLTLVDRRVQVSGSGSVGDFLHDEGVVDGRVRLELDLLVDGTGERHAAASGGGRQVASVCAR